MKRNLTVLLVLACTFASAQNINDVLRYSNENIQGTARFQGMGGAFGALGGDLSALNVNPAGSAVFANGQFTISGSNYNRNNDASYFGNDRSTDLNTFDINQVGAVFVFNNTNSGSEWKKFSLAVNYDLVNQMDNEIFVAGTSNQGIDNYFLDYAQGVPFGPLLLQDGEYIDEAYLDIGASLGFVDQQAFLGYFGGIIDPVDMDDDNNIEYISNARYSNVNQAYSKSTAGYNSKFTLNMASQYGENIYLGASMNIHTVSYDELTRFSESGYDSDSEIQFVDFDNFLHTEGSGFSFSLGGIAKLTESLRLGASYQSPTWYRLTDDTSQRINSDLADADIDFIDFNDINLFERYTIKTPSKLTGSLAMVFGIHGLLSLDYSYQDMSKAELRPTSDPAFSSENSYISNTLTGVSAVRLGGEYRLDRISLRGGFRYEQSPYQNGDTIGDLQGYSAGIGYNFGGSRLDLAYYRSEQDVDLQLFNSGLTTPASINNINNNITLGYTLNF